MNKDQKEKILIDLIERSKLIKNSSSADPIFREWILKVERTLIKIFGEKSLEVKEFKKIEFKSSTAPFSIATETAMHHVEKFKRGFETVIRSINQYIEEIQKEPENTPPLLNPHSDSNQIDI